MKITLSKSQWEFIGQKTGWIKKAKIEDPNVCPGCENWVEDDDQQISKDNQKWHSICWEEEQRIQERQAEQDRDYDPQD